MRLPVSATGPADVFGSWHRDSPRRWYSPRSWVGSREGYPDVALEITTDDNRMDLVAGRFDAGIHLGDFLERDVIAVKVSPDQRPAIVASPDYFESHARPLTPRDLVNHRCINIRVGAEGVYRWSLNKDIDTLRL